MVPGAIDAEAVARVRRAYERRLDDIIARAVRLGQMDAPASAAAFGEKLTALLCARAAALSAFGYFAANDCRLCGGGRGMAAAFRRRMEKMRPDFLATILFLT